jgi:cytochrome P450
VLKEDIEVCGQSIRKGWSILCMLGAANRDPKRFKEPNQLNLKKAEQTNTWRSVRARMPALGRNWQG